MSLAGLADSTTAVRGELFQPLIFDLAGFTAHSVLGRQTYTKDSSDEGSIVIFRGYTRNISHEFVH